MPIAGVVEDGAEALLALAPGRRARRASSLVVELVLGDPREVAQQRDLAGAEARAGAVSITHSVPTRKPSMVVIGWPA